MVEERSGIGVKLSLSPITVLCKKITTTLRLIDITTRGNPGSRLNGDIIQEYCIPRGVVGEFALSWRYPFQPINESVTHDLGFLADSPSEVDVRSKIVDIRGCSNGCCPLGCHMVIPNHR